MEGKRVALNMILMGVLVSFLAGCSQEPVRIYEWRLQSQAVEQSIDFQELITFSKNVELMSQGRLKISVHPGGEIAGGPQIFDAVRDGTVEMGNGWPNWWSGQNPAWAVMNAGPFDFMNLDASMMFFLAGDGTELANKMAKKDGLVWRPAWWPGMEFGLLSREPINGLDDLKGKKVRIGPGLPSEVLAEASGSYSVPLVPQEIRPALENGDLDAVEWTTTAGALSLGISDVSPYAIVPAIWQPSVLSDFLINAAAYEQLPNDLQAILETAIKAYTLTTTMKAKVADIAALDEFKKSGTTIKSWSASDIDRWRLANDKIIATYKERDPYTKELIEAKQFFKSQYNEYYRYFGAYE